MKRESLRYFFILLIFLIIINVNIISAEEIDQAASPISDQILIDEDELNEVSQSSEANSVQTNDGEGDTLQSSDDLENDLNDSDSAELKSNSTNEVALKKTYLNSPDYVIKSKYLNVSLKDNSKKALSKKKVYLTINGKNFDWFDGTFLLK